jgi:hypothetical protein
VMLLVMMPAAAATTIATAARSLTIVWSHYLRPVTCRTVCVLSCPLPFPGAVTADYQRDQLPSATNGPSQAPPRG